MPSSNCFRHQDYSDRRPRAPYELLFAELPPGENTPEYRQRMKRVAQTLTAAGVDNIILVHGTFVGNDGIGFIRHLERLHPKLGVALRNKQKLWCDQIMGERGNYTELFAQRMANRLSEANWGGSVRLFNWSSQNHHVGRAEAAIELLSELFRLHNDRQRHVQLWGHSHGGNVFALVSNLLGGPSNSTREHFFSALRPLVASLSTEQLTLWNSVEERLQQPNPLSNRQIDFVTFGTPICYGWETGGYDNLLHFVYHRPADGLPEYLAPFPKIKDVLSARYGDFAQQFAVAGTNLSIPDLGFRNWRAERRLAKLLQSNLSKRSVIARLKSGMRVPTEGRTMLVDYSSGGRAHHLALGHGVYTYDRWMLFHLEQIAKYCYTDNEREKPHGCGYSDHHHY